MPYVSIVCMQKRYLKLPALVRIIISYLKLYNRM